MGEMKRIWEECREVAVDLVNEHRLDGGRDVVSITNSLFAARCAASTKKPVEDKGAKPKGSKFRE